MDKKHLGQFYTTNYKYILQNLSIPEGTTTIIEPFCGSDELLNFIEIETFDIDPKIKLSETRDTILNPPSYQDKYILTNPPYLARNKCKEKNL